MAGKTKRSGLGCRESRLLLRYCLADPAPRPTLSSAHRGTLLLPLRDLANCRSEADETAAQGVRGKGPQYPCMQRATVTEEVREKGAGRGKKEG
jgi:hypothetical protein